MQGKLILLIAIVYTLRTFWNQFSSWAEFVKYFIDYFVK